jgi:hypothetical protein
MGGTLLYCKKFALEIGWVIVTSISPRYEKRIQCKEKIDILKKSIKEQITQVSNELCVSEIWNLNFPTLSLDTIPKGEIIEKFIEIINGYRPELIFVNGSFDMNFEHEIVFDCLQNSTKMYYNPQLKGILAYETPSSTDARFSENPPQFTPNFYVDISEFLDKKIELCKIYENEFKNDSINPRSEWGIKNYAGFRGLQIAVKYAEAFKSYRLVEKE